MKRFILFFFILFIQNIAAQKSIIEFTNDQADIDEKISNSYPITNEQNGDLLFFLEGRKKYHAYLFNSDFKKTHSLSFEKLQKKYNQYLGYSILEDNYTIIYTNESKKKLGIISLNFKKETSITNVIDLKLNNETLLETFSYKNKLYLISAKSVSKNISIHIYDGNQLKKHSIDLDGPKKTKDLLTLEMI